MLSLDGRKEVHDKMRPFTEGVGSYDKVLANLQAAVQSRNDQNYYLRGTFTAHNLDFAADVLSMADAGFSQLSVEPVVGKDVDYAITEEDLHNCLWNMRNWLKRIWRDARPATALISSISISTSATVPASRNGSAAAARDMSIWP